MLNRRSTEAALPAPAARPTVFVTPSNTTSLQLVSSCGRFVAHVPLEIACKSVTIARTILAGPFRERLEARVQLSNIDAPCLRVIVAYMLKDFATSAGYQVPFEAQEEHVISVSLVSDTFMSGCNSVCIQLLVNVLLAGHYLEMSSLTHSSARLLSSNYSVSSQFISSYLPDELLLLVLHFCKPFDWLITEIHCHRASRKLSLKQLWLRLLPKLTSSAEFCPGIHGSDCITSASSPDSWCPICSSMHHSSSSGQPWRVARQYVVNAFLASALHPLGTISTRSAQSDSLPNVPVHAMHYKVLGELGILPDWCLRLDSMLSMFQLLGSQSNWLDLSFLRTRLASMIPQSGRGQLDGQYLSRGTIDTKWLHTMLTSLPHPSIVDLRNNPLDVDTLSSIVRVLPVWLTGRNAHVAHESGLCLDLSFTRLTPVSIRVLSAALSDSGKTSNVRQPMSLCLMLGRTELSDAHINKLAFVLSKLPSSHLLSALDLSRNAIGSNILVLCAALVAQKALKLLNLSQCSLGSAGVKIVCDHLTRLPALRWLSLAGNSTHADRLSAEVYSDLLQLPEMPLGHLNLSHNFLDPSALINLSRSMSRNQHLTYLSLASCNLNLILPTSAEFHQPHSPWASLALALCQHPTLQSLIVSDNSLPNWFMCMMFEAMQNNHSLVVLDAAGNHFDANCARFLSGAIRFRRHTSPGAILFSSQLAVSPEVSQSLSLSDNPFCYLNFGGIHDGSHIRPEGASYLASFLAASMCESPFPAVLSLANQNIRNSGLVSLFRPDILSSILTTSCHPIACAQRRRILFMNLRHNLITDKGILTIASEIESLPNALCSCGIVLIVDLRDNDLGTVGLTVVSELHRELQQHPRAGIASLQLLCDSTLADDEFNSHIESAEPHSTSVSPVRTSPVEVAKALSSVTASNELQSLDDSESTPIIAALSDQSSAPLLCKCACHPAAVDLSVKFVLHQSLAHAQSFVEAWIDRCATGTALMLPSAPVHLLDHSFDYLRLQDSNSTPRTAEMAQFAPLDHHLTVAAERSVDVVADMLMAQRLDRGSISNRPSALYSDATSKSTSRTSSHAIDSSANRPASLSIQPASPRVTLSSLTPRARPAPIMSTGLTHVSAPIPAAPIRPAVHTPAGVHFTSQHVLDSHRPAQSMRVMAPGQLPFQLSSLTPKPPQGSQRGPNRPSRTRF